jgi:putative spermidine/putrescine transport system ATP-binding protein
VLKGIDLEVKKGDLVTLLGPSGCGKSTLLRCLAGLESVTEGKVYLDGKDITHLPPKDRDIGMVFQQYSLFPNMTVGQNVAFGMKMKKMPKDTIENRVKEILGLVHLDEKIDQYPAQLSGGQQQRVALARAIVTEPKVLLLDEPLSAIDALLRRELQVEIRRLQQRLNITTIFVTHDQDEAMVMSDVIHLMNGGVIEQSGNPISMYTKPSTKFAATFIGHYNIIPTEVFAKAAGEKPECVDVAIRPEIFSISAAPTDEENAYKMKGTIVASMPHGNIIRYTVECSDIEFDVDVMFDSSLLFNLKQEVYLAVKKDEVIEL